MLIRTDDCLRPATPYHDALALRDVEGRPLGESNAPAACQAGVAIEWRACPYDDSRGQVPGARINVSALRQITRRFPALLGAVAFLRDAYVRRTGCAAWTLPHLWTFGRIGTSIPTYLTRRRVDPVEDGQIPVLVAAMFKSLAGVFLAADAIALDAILDGRCGGDGTGQVDVFAADDPDAALTVDGLVTLTNLVGAMAHGEAVCAGPPAMIEELLDVIVSGAATEASELEAILGDVDDFFAFAHRMNAITIVRDLLRHQLRDEHARLRDHGTRLPAAMTDHILRTLAARDHATAIRLYQPGAASMRPAMTRWLESRLALSGAPSVAELSAAPDVDPVAQTLAACDAHERRALARLEALCGHAIDPASIERISGLPSWHRPMRSASLSR